MRVAVLLISAVFLLTSGGEQAWAKSARHKHASDPDYYTLKEEPANADMDDPWENFNHPIFDFNVFFDKHVFKPVIYAYDNVPQAARHSIHNFLVNLTEPLNTIHGILQLNPKIAFTSVWRFILNSTFGLGGLDDFAGRNARLNNMDQDLGKTLGRWGVPAGPYVVLPVIGPSSVRDTTGRVGDWFADPVGWAETYWESGGQALADGIDRRDTQAGLVEHLYYESLDPYVSTRATYRQHERFEETSRD